MARKLVRSTNLRSVGYDPTSMILEIEFHSGGVYQYFRVPSSIYNALMYASSLGSFHYHNIRTRYQFRRVY